MTKKYWQENITLIIVIILMIVGFVVVKNYLVEILTGKIEQIELSQVKRMKDDIKEMTVVGFDFPIFSQETYIDLEEFIIWPLEIIDNQGNPEPFKEKEIEICPGGVCPTE